MKLIKAYVRPSRVGTIIDILKEKKIGGISAVDVKGLGPDMLSYSHQLSLELDSQASTLVKIEVYCKDIELDPILSTILDETSTGSQGDGLISVSTVDRIIHIRNKREQQEDETWYNEDGIK